MLLPCRGGGSTACSLLLLLLAAGSSLAAAQNTTANPCFFASHFVVPAATAAATCLTQCNAVLAAQNNKGSIYPETYKASGGQTCCKCQYSSTAYAGDPSPGSGTSSSTPSSTSSGSTTGSSTASGTKTSSSSTATKTKKKSTIQRVWWKVAIGVGIFCILFLITIAMFCWDCFNCRKNRVKVADLKEAAEAERAGRKGGKRATMSKDAQRRLAALDLARDMRETRLEAQPPAKFTLCEDEQEEDLAAAAATGGVQCLHVEPPCEVVVAAAAPASAPASPARHRRGRGFATLV